MSAKYIFWLFLFLFVSSANAVTVEEDYAAGKKAVEDHDIVTALPLLKRAADQGHRESQSLYAFLVDTAESDPVEALKYYKMAADNGDPEAELRLSVAYGFAELGLKKDDAEALRWLRRAAERNYRSGVVGMAEAYVSGRFGLDKLKAEGRPDALSWIDKAAELGDPGIMLFYVDAYAKGDARLGLAKDDQKALFWLKKLVENGSIPAMERLAEIYRTGGLGQAPDVKQVKFYESEIKKLKKSQKKKAPPK